MITDRIYEQKETKALKAPRDKVSSEFIFVLLVILEKQTIRRLPRLTYQCYSCDRWSDLISASLAELLETRIQDVTID